jgi:hypothetical protein
MLVKVLVGLQCAIETIVIDGRSKIEYVSDESWGRAYEIPVSFFDLESARRTNLPRPGPPLSTRPPRLHLP